MFRLSTSITSKTRRLGRQICEDGHSSGVSPTWHRLAWYQVPPTRSVQHDGLRNDISARPRPHGGRLCGDDQRETIKFIESRLGQPAAIAVRESSGHYHVVASEDLDAGSVTERLQSCVNGLPRFEYLSNNRGGIANFQPDSTTIVSQNGPEPDLLMMSFTLPGYRSSFREMDSLASLISEAMNNFRKFDELERASNIDALTGLPNRRSLMEPPSS